MSGDFLSFMEAKKNINRQATKVLHDIVYAYERGILDDPSQAAHFCGLLACICEGKVEGSFDEASGLIRWSLTTKYSEQLEKLKEDLLSSALKSDKTRVVKGPW